MSAQSTTVTLPTPISSSASVQITYDVLTPFHNERHRIVKRGKNKGKERSSQQVENDDSALHQFLKDLNPPKSKSDLIGDEFGKDFEKLLKKHLKNVKDNYKKRKEEKGESVDEKSANQNVNNRKSKLKAWHESYRAMLAYQHLPDGFKASLKLLLDDYIKNHKNITIYAIAKKCGIPKTTLAEWAYGTRNPTPTAKDKIAALEKFFNLPAGILWLKLPYRADKSNLKSQATPHRKLLALKAKDKYILPEFPPAVQEEWDGLVKLYTKKSEIEDPAAAIDEGLELNDDESSGRKEDVIWRKRLDGINITERFKNLLARTFFGFLLRDLSDPYDQELINTAIEVIKKHRRAKGKEIDRGANRGSKKNSGTWLTSRQIDEKRGKRFNEEDLSLALLGDARLTYPYIQWKRARTGEVFYNSFVKSHLQFCSQLVHPDTGYLTKHPEFGKRLPVKIENEKEWIEWCKSSHRKFNTYLTQVAGY
jgi:transcriptional regulator with XRE-family HTH domain